MWSIFTQYRRRAAAGAFGLAAGALLWSQAAVAQAFPERPLRLVVPYAAGQGADISARLIADRLARLVGQPVVVENKPGAGGNIGAAYVAKARADGYTLLYGTNAINAANVSLYRDMGFKSEEIVPVAMINRSPMVISARADGADRSIAELFDRARAQPKGLNIGLPSTTAAVVLGELERLSGLKFLGVPYKGSPTAMQDLFGGRLEATIDTVLATLPQVRSGKLRALAVSSAQRAQAFADTPTLAESGVQGFDLGPWSIIAAPAGTPAPALELLNTRIRQVMADPEVRQIFLTQSGVVVGPDSDMTVAQVGAFVNEEIEKWGRVIRAAGLSAD